MIESWAGAVAAAERGLRGDPAARAAVARDIDAFVRHHAAMPDAERVGHLARLVSLLDALGLPRLSRIAVDSAAEWALSAEHLHSVSRLPVRHQLVRMLVERGEAEDLDTAQRLLSLPLTDATATSGLAGASTLASFAALRLRLGPSPSGTELTPAELARVAWDRLATEEPEPGPEPEGASGPESEPGDSRAVLEARLLLLSVLLEQTRQADGPADPAAAEQLAAEAESVCRRLVALLGGEHPRCLAALVTLSAAEFEAARAAGARERGERAVDVLSLVAQRSAATLGRDHPQARGAFAMLACLEFEAAQDAGDEPRTRRAVELVRKAADRVRRDGCVAPAESAETKRDEGLGASEPAHERPVTQPGFETTDRGSRSPVALDPASARLRFTVLGPVRAWRGEEALAMGPPQQRALLAALLLRGGQTATAEELIDAIWGEERPEHAMAALRTYASRIRKALGSEAGLLVNEWGGYALRLEAEDLLDLDRTYALVGAAERSVSDGDLASAREQYDTALTVWEGEPLAHLPGPYARMKRDSLEERRLNLLEHRLDLDLQLGCHAEAVSELTALTAVHPLRERLRELLMLALYRSGRQAEALAVYADTRRLLADELGLDPRRELSDLQQRILEADDELAYQADEPSESATRTITRPAQLPATVADFTGRAPFVAELGDQLAQAEGTVMAVSAVAGIGSVGKTTLAIHVAHAAAERFPDGQLYVDLQGSGASPADPESVLGSFLRALGTPDSAIPDGVEERSALFRSLLAGRRVLALLDNARDAAQVRPLLPGTAGCATLVTSRVRMVDLAGAYLVDLDVMSPDEAMMLFTRIVGEERVGAEREAATDVVAACGFQPLAIRIAAARLAARRTWTVSVLARKLADERSRLDELQAGDLAVDATFELGYGQLDPDQARAFRLLGLVEGPDISLRAAAAMLGLTPEDAEDLLESLVDTSLLESAAPGRYRLHDLVRLFARARAERNEQREARETALGRLLDFYLATARNVYALERPAEHLVGHLELPARGGLRFSCQSEALDWLLSESDCFLACARRMGEGDTVGRAVDLLVATSALAESGVNNRRYEQVAEELKAACQAAGNSGAEARAQSVLSGLHLATGQFEAAEEEARLAWRLARTVNDPLPRPYTLHDLGVVAMYQGRHHDARDHLNEALEVFRSYGNLGAEARALSNLAQAHTGLGETGTAVSLAERALELQGRLEVPTQRASTLYALGRALEVEQRLDEAEQRFREALSLFREGRRRLWEGMTHYHLGSVFLALQQPARAAEQAEQALAILRGVGGSWRRGSALTLLGRALDSAGHHRRAQTCWQEALALFQQLGSGEAEEVAALLEPTRAR